VANQIRELREVDLPLDEVKQVLTDPVSLDELLDRHEARLIERLTESEQTLALLRQMREKKEEKLVPVSVEVRELPVLRAACVEIHSALDRIGPDCQKAFGRLMGELGAAGLTPSGPCVMGYPDEDFDPESFLALVGIQVDGDLPAQSFLKVAEFPGGKAAVGTLVGPYEGLTQAWQDVHTWVSEQGLKTSGMPYEIYRVDHLTAPLPAEIETDIVVPVS